VRSVSSNLFCLKNLYCAKFIFILNEGSFILSEEFFYKLKPRFYSLET